MVTSGRHWIRLATASALERGSLPGSTVRTKSAPSCLANFSRLSLISRKETISQADGRPPCVNDDITIQWEWSNFDPSQNQNPLTDYDKTLHNWLRPRDKQVTQNLCQSVVRVRLGKYMKYNTKHIFIFFPGLAYWSDPWADFHEQWLKLRVITQGMPFWGLRDGRPHLGDQIPPKPATYRQKIGHFVREVDDNEERRCVTITSENDNSSCSFTASKTEQNTYNCKTAHIVNILILCTSTEHVFSVSPFCRTPYNDTINWRSGKHRILIFDENNRFQRKRKYWKIKKWAKIASKTANINVQDRSL